MPIHAFLAAALFVLGAQSAPPHGATGTPPTARLTDPRGELHLPDRVPKLDTSVPLRVGTCDLPPWSIKPELPDGMWTGIAVHLLREMTDDLGLRVEMHSYDLPGLLQALERGEIDIAATGIGITPEHLVQFTMTPAFDQSGLSIATHTRPPLTFGTVLRRISTDQVALWALLLAISCVCFGALLWVAERRRNSQFNSRAIDGLAQASWWSVVTMFTVGYGDRVPITHIGRLVAVVWMCVSFVLVVVASGLVTSALTVQQLQPVVTSARDLSSARVACVDGTDGQKFLLAANLKPTVFATYEEAVAALEHVKVDAIVGSTASLAYLVGRSHDRHLTVLAQPIRSDYVGFGMRYGLPDAVEKNLELEMLKVSQTDQFRAYRDTVFGLSAGDSQ